jgi:hypothetical protein
LAQRRKNPLTINLMFLEAMAIVWISSNGLSTPKLATPQKPSVF